MYKKRLLPIVLVLTVLLLTVSPASAITYGESDGDGHPYVGGIQFYDDNFELLWFCTGTLVSPKLIVTAGHCAGFVEEVWEWGIAAYAQVWFDPVISYDPTYVPWDSCEGKKNKYTAYPCAGGIWGQPIPHPDWSIPIPSRPVHDIGVVVLDKPYKLTEYAVLPEAGYLNQLLTQRGLQETQFTVVGYGTQAIIPKFISSGGVRNVGTVSLINLISSLNGGYYFQHTGDPGEGNGPGGTCFGDSGGPVFHNDYLVAVTSFRLNFNCAGPGFAYRTDTEAARDFLSEFITLP